MTLSAYPLWITILSLLTQACGTDRHRSTASSVSANQAQPEAERTKPAWAGTYSGNVRQGKAPPQQGALVIRMKGDDAVVFFTSPTVGAPCAIDFRHSGPLQELPTNFGDVSCRGDNGKVMFQEGELRLDGDNIVMTLTAVREAKGDYDFLKVEFLGSRGPAQEEAKFPAFAFGQKE